jgi:hypothetical protein
MKCLTLANASATMCNCIKTSYLRMPLGPHVKWMLLHSWGLCDVMQGFTALMLSEQKGISYSSSDPRRSIAQSLCDLWSSHWGSPAHKPSWPWRPDALTVILNSSSRGAVSPRGPEWGS